MKELGKVESYLVNMGIRYERRPVFRNGAKQTDVEQIIAYSADGERDWDVLEDRNELSHLGGLLEGMGIIFRWPGEHVTAEDLIGRLERRAQGRQIVEEMRRGFSAYKCEKTAGSRSNRGCDVYR